MATIEGMVFNLWVDNDRLNLKLLSFRGKTRWLELRIEKVLLEPLRRLDIAAWEDKHHEEASFVLIHGAAILNGVEALGGFLGGVCTGENFRRFVRDYMPAYKTHHKLLRNSFRNGLAHGFSVKDGGFEFQPTDLRSRPYGLQLDPEKLLKNFEGAVKHYFNDLNTAGEHSSKGKQFSRRFKSAYLKKH